MGEMYPRGERCIGEGIGMYQRETDRTSRDIGEKYIRDRRNVSDMEFGYI